ncbi:MAG: hypothetical protein VXV96_05885 [Bdellovibrionota bacterium]|nr:hypothetical protein [Bdellovibrionota bacterium]
MEKDWIKLLTHGNTKPFINKENKYQSEFFSQKFSPSLMKVLQLKGLNLTFKRIESDTLFGADIAHLTPRSLLLPFHFGEYGLIGWVSLSENFVELALHRLLGGSSVTELSVAERPLSPLEKTTLKQLNSPFEVSIREGLKGLLGIHSAVIGNPWERLDLERELATSESYFCETFLYEEGPVLTPLQVFLRVSPFNP